MTDVNTNDGSLKWVGVNKVLPDSGAGDNAVDFEPYAYGIDFSPVNKTVALANDSTGLGSVYRFKAYKNQQSFLRNATFNTSCRISNDGTKIMAYINGTQRVYYYDTSVDNDWSSSGSVILSSGQIRAFDLNEDGSLVAARHQSDQAIIELREFNGTGLALRSSRDLATYARIQQIKISADGSRVFALVYEYVQQDYRIYRADITGTSMGSFSYYNIVPFYSTNDTTMAVSYTGDVVFYNDYFANDLYWNVGAVSTPSSPVVISMESESCTAFYGSYNFAKSDGKYVPMVAYRGDDDYVRFVYPTLDDSTTGYDMSTLIQHAKINVADLETAFGDIVNYIVPFSMTEMIVCYRGESFNHKVVKMGYEPLTGGIR